MFCNRVKVLVEYGPLNPPLQEYDLVACFVDAWKLQHILFITY